jgi:hypothetical protein
LATEKEDRREKREKEEKKKGSAASTAEMRSEGRFGMHVLVAAEAHHRLGTFHSRHIGVGKENLHS